MEPLELTILAKDVETLAYLFVLQINLEINAPLGGRHPLESWLRVCAQFSTTVFKPGFKKLHLVLCYIYSCRKKGKRVNQSSIDVIFWLLNSFFN